ncbi:MAG: hypothetical protein RLZ22_906 [Verrucomicrobiota bacterium]|mgnify:CR=1 FL=1|jgi:hypothetical protein
MPATIYKASSVSSVEFGITNETGILLSSFSRNVTANKSELRDAEGEVVAVAITGKQAEITLEGTLNGSATMQVGNLLTLSNDIDKYGLADGTVIVNSVQEKSAAGEFKTISVSATQYSATMED